MKMGPTITDIAEVFYNKTIAIVGGAPGYDDEEAEERDLIIRINNHWSRSGGRADAIYSTATEPLTTTPDEPLLYLAYDSAGEQAAQHDQWSRRYTLGAMTYTNRIYGLPNPIGPECEWLNQFNRELGCEAFTGMLALRHIQMMPVKEIYLTGFTFYMDSERRVPYMRDPHLIGPHIEWLARQRKYDMRLSMDEELGRIIDGDWSYQPYTILEATEDGWKRIEQM
jgi:hypothetical protein